MVAARMGCTNRRWHEVSDLQDERGLLCGRNLRLMHYVELHARSAFSFLRGASLPEQLAETAGDLGLPAIALSDRNGVYGAPRFFGRAKEMGVRPIVGAELTMEDQTVLPVLVESRAGYRNLCQLLTRAHLRNEKGKASVRWDELPEFSEGVVT